MKFFKYLRLCFLCWLFVLNAKAQSDSVKWGGLSFSTSNYYINFTDAEHIKQSKSVLNFSASLDHVYQIDSTPWFLSVGAGFSSRGLQRDFEEEKANENPRDFHLLKAGYISGSLSMYYNLFAFSDENFNIRPFFGIIPAVLIHKNEKIFFKNKEKVTENRLGKHLNEVNIGLSAGSALIFNFNEKLSFYLEPSIVFQTIKPHNSIIENHPVGFTTRMGIYYNLSRLEFCKKIKYW